MSFQYMFTIARMSNGTFWIYTINHDHRPGAVVESFNTYDEAVKGIHTELARTYPDLVGARIPSLDQLNAEPMHFAQGCLELVVTHRKDCACIFKDDLAEHQWVIIDHEVDDTGYHLSSREIAKGLSYPDAVNQANQQVTLEPGKYTVQHPWRFQDDPVHHDHRICARYDE